MEKGASKATDKDRGSALRLGLEGVWPEREEGHLRVGLGPRGGEGGTFELLGTVYVGCGDKTVARRIVSRMLDVLRGEAERSMRVYFPEAAAEECDDEEGEEGEDGEGGGREDDPRQPGGERVDLAPQVLDDLVREMDRNFEGFYGPDGPLGRVPASVRRAIVERSLELVEAIRRSLEKRLAGLK